MEANSIIISKIFGYKSQYCAPLYQRPYVWGEENQWVPMWDDIKNVAEKILEGEDDPTPHFLGAIVLEQQKSSVSRPDSRLIIDGQQRLATLQFVLKSILFALKSFNSTAIAEIVWMQIYPMPISKEHDSTWRRCEE